jgi:guanylate kinase
MLAQRDPTLHEVISYKTRQLRPGEVDGIDYHYITEDDFTRAKDRDEFLEYATIHHLFSYGTKKYDIVDGLADGKTLIKEVDIQGLDKILTGHPELIPQMYTIFLDISDDVMTKRITSRAPIAPEELAQRHASAQHERAKAKELCSIVVDSSGTPEEVYEKVEALIHVFLLQKKYTDYCAG